MPIRPTLLATGLGLTLTLAACGGDEPTEVAATPAAAEAPTDTAPTTPSDDQGPTAIDVLAGETDLGSVLIGPDGRTLYGFTNDVDAISTCYGTCADAWPPVIVSDDWTAGPGLDFGIFATTVREDGQRQLVAGRWPLYHFAGDAAPGDLNGQGSGDVWFAVDLNGGLIADAAPADDPATATATDDQNAPGGQDGTAADDDPLYGDPGGQADDDQAAAAPVTSASTDIGSVLVDETGRTLYGFLDDRDVDGSACNGPCADAWPPVVLSSTTLPDGLDPDVFSVITRDDGTKQLTAGIWPLYRFAGDGGPGDLNGQGSGGVWFAAAPDGSLVGTP